MRIKALRTARVVLLSAGLVLAATIVASPAGTLAGSGQGSGCADPTPARHMAKHGPATGAVTDPAIQRAVASHKSGQDTMSPADRAAGAVGEANSAKKMARARARARARGFAPAANVAHFSSRSEALQVCAGATSTGAAAQLGSRVARAFAPSAYACAQNDTCTTGSTGGTVAPVTWINNLNHQDEGGSGTWCGPATVSMIALTEPGPSYVTQQTARDYISALQGSARPVETAGSDDSSVVAALGQYVTGPNLGITSWYVFVQLPDSPTSQDRSNYHARLVDDIYNYGYAVAGNIHEQAWGPHLPGHPAGQEIFHYIEIGGYDESDGTDWLADSATGVPSWGAQVNAYLWFDESTLVTILGTRGYIW